MVSNLKSSTPMLVLVGGLVVIAVIAVISASSIWPSTGAVDMEQVKELAMQFIAQLGTD